MKLRIAFYAALVLALIVWMEGPAVLLGIADPFVGGGPGLLADGTPGFTPQIHRWHNAVFPTGMGLLVSACLIGLIRRVVQRPVLLQFAVAGHVLMLVSVATSGRVAAFVVFAIWMVTCALLIAFYPRRELLLAYRSPRGWSGPLLALTAIAAVLLSVDIWMNVGRTIAGVGGEHLTFGHWMQAANVDLLLILAGLMAASRLAGYRALAGITGGVFIFLGLAALELPNQAGSWGVAGGLIALAAGVGYVVLSVTGERLSARVTPQSDASASVSATR